MYPGLYAPGRRIDHLVYLALSYGEGGGVCSISEIVILEGGGREGAMYSASYAPVRRIGLSVFGII